MIEILPIRSLTNEDSLIFGNLAVTLGKLNRIGFSVGNGIVITAPDLKLKTILEHFDFGHKEIFEQSLSLVRKEINKLAVPEILKKETNPPAGGQKLFLNGEIIKSTNDLWQKLLDFWLTEIKNRLWLYGFYPGLTQNLDPQVVIFVKKVESAGTAFFDSLQSDSVIKISSGKLHPNDLKKLDQIVKDANKKLFIPHEYEWIVDRGLKIIGVKPYTPASFIPAYSSVIPAKAGIHLTDKLLDPRLSLPHATTRGGDDSKTSAVKVFLDLSQGLVVEREVDGVYIASEKIFDLNKPKESFENLVFKLVESANTFPTSPILFKLADKSEGMGKVRGSLRLLHQKNLFGPMVDALDFVRHKKGLINVHLVIPYVRGVNEFLQIKRELAVKKFTRKNSLKFWLEVAVPENIVNLEDYLVAGLDGVVLNLDELISHLNGFDHLEQELTFYKNEVKGLIKFLEDGLKLLHKSKVPFIAYGSLSMYPEVLEFLIEKGIYGVVVERYEASSSHELLHQVEKRMILRRE